MNPAAERPFGRHATPRLPSVSSGKRECFSMFGSLKEFHIAVCDFTTHIPLSLPSLNERSSVPSKETTIIVFYLIASSVERRVVFMDKNGVHTIVIPPLIVNAEGLGVRNPFSIQSEWKILWRRPWRRHRTHLELLKKRFPCRKQKDYTLDCLLAYQKHTCCSGRSRLMTSDPRVVEGHGCMTDSWEVGQRIGMGRYTGLGLVRQQNYLYLYWNKKQK